MPYRIAYYFVAWNSVGLDDHADAATEKEAIAAARTRVRDSSNPGAHALIRDDEHRHLYTVERSKGRLYTRRKT